MKSYIGIALVIMALCYSICFKFIEHDVNTAIYFVLIALLIETWRK